MQKKRPITAREDQYFSYFIFALLTLIWGSNFILMKKASIMFGPIAISLTRVILGAVVLWIVYFFSEKKWPFSKDEIIPLLIPVLVGCVFPYSILPWLIERNGSGIIGMLIGLVPIMTVIVSIPLLGDKPDNRKLMGVVGGLFFLILLFSDTLKRDGKLWDMVLASIVPFCYAFTNTYIKRRFKDKSPLALSCVVLSMAGIVLLPLLFLLPWPMIKPIDGGWSTTAILAMLANGILATGAATFGFYYLIKKRGPLFAGLVAYLIPFGTIFWGWVDGEVVTSIQLISITGILLMVAYIEYGTKRRNVK